MTTSEPSRLDRIENLLVTVAERQSTFQDQLEITQKIADSNARSTQANSTAISELRQSQTETLNELRSSVEDIIQMLTTQAEQASADRAELRRMIEAMYGQRRNGNGNAGE